MAELKRILHVEDDPDVLEITLLALETLGGLVVEQCGSAKEALAKATAFSPDLFLLDVMMPDASGMDTLQVLRSAPQFSNTPAIFMTAKIRPVEVDALFDLGAIDVITKPFDPVTLADRIKASWERAV